MTRQDFPFKRKVYLYFMQIKAAFICYIYDNSGEQSLINLIRRLELCIRLN